MGNSQSLSPTFEVDVENVQHGEPEIVGRTTKEDEQHPRRMDSNNNNGSTTTTSKRLSCCEPTPEATTSSSSSSSSVSSSSYVSAYDGVNGTTPLDSFFKDNNFNDIPITTTTVEIRSTTKYTKKYDNKSFCFPQLVPNISLFQRRPNPLSVVDCDDTPLKTSTPVDDVDALDRSTGRRRKDCDERDYSNYYENDNDDDEGYYHFDDAIRKQRGKSSLDCCSSPLPYYSNKTSSPLGFISIRSRPSLSGSDSNNNNNKMGTTAAPIVGVLESSSSDLLFVDASHGSTTVGYDVDSDHCDDELDNASSTYNCINDPNTDRRRREQDLENQLRTSSSSLLSTIHHSNKKEGNDQGTTSASRSLRRMFDQCYPNSNSTSSNSICSATTVNNNPLFLLRSASSSNTLLSSFGSNNNNNSNSCSNFGNINYLSDPDPEWQYTQDELEMIDGDDPTDESNLQIPRSYWIVTTAALPWMTGTACNPLLRAAYLSQRNRQLSMTQEQTNEDNLTRTVSTTNANNKQQRQQQNVESCCTVTLVLPWLESPDDRRQLYGSSWAEPNKTSADQEAYIRDWLATAAHLPMEAKPPHEGGVAIEWYPARYHSALSSIFALGDLCEMIPTTTGSNRNNDTICILEEPEHVNFYRAPGRESWRDKFGHVIGVVHTNYKAYARNHYSGILTGPLVGALSSLMVRAYCDKVVKLSPVLQEYAPGKEVVSNVHGIRQEFFHVPLPSTCAVQCYFIGKLLWAKGLDKLLELEAHYRKKTGKYFEIDVVGSGPEQKEIERSFLGKQQKQQGSNNECMNNKDNANASKLQPKRYWRYFRQPIPARFLGRHDHAEIGSHYNIFVNPSITEVLCTTTAEAVAMSKWVIVPRHASNEFFLQFPNCLQYTNKNEFVDLLQYAMTNSVHCVIGNGSAPTTLAGQESSVGRAETYASLTWEAATDRLIDTAYLSKREARRRDRLTLQKEDRSIQEWHFTLGNGKSGDVLRKVLGGGPVAEQSTYKRESSSLSLATFSGLYS